jgi:hypothetical protein
MEEKDVKEAFPFLFKKMEERNRASSLYTAKLFSVD